MNYSVILGLQCLISKLGMIRTVPTRQGCTEVEITHVMGFTQSQAHGKCSINLSYYCHLLLPWPYLVCHHPRLWGAWSTRKGLVPTLQDSPASGMILQQGKEQPHGLAYSSSECLLRDGISENAGANPNFRSRGSVLGQSAFYRCGN